MFDDRKEQAPFAVVFLPGQSIGYVKRMAPEEASAAVGGHPNIARWGNDLVVYHANYALAETLDPNRIFEDHAINGPMIVMGRDAPLSGREACEMAWGCPWRMVMRAVS